MAKEQYFALIPQDTAYSEELNALSPTARWIYVVLAAERRGRKVAFKFPYARIREITHFADTTIRRALVVLEQAGFLTYEHGGLEANPNLYEMEHSWLTVD